MSSEPGGDEVSGEGGGGDTGDTGAGGEVVQVCCHGGNDVRHVIVM